MAGLSVTEGLTCPTYSLHPKRDLASWLIRRVVAEPGMLPAEGDQIFARADLPGLCIGKMESTISPPLTARMERRVSLSYA